MPNNNNPEDILVFAKTNFRNQFRNFGIKKDDRRRHMYLIGKTGMGKSTVLENMIIGDIEAGRGIALVDPHGDLAEKVIKFIPSNRVNDVVYFNPSDMEFPVAFNVLEKVAPELRHLVASGLVGVFKKLWADSWGPRLEYILRNAILAIMDYPGATLLAVSRLLSDKEFRKKVIEKIQDPVVKAFWVKEFAGYADKFASEAVSPIQNKVGQFLSSSLVRNIVGQVKSSINLRDIMDNEKILIMNLSKGRIGEDNAAMLGSMMVTKIQLAAMSRVDTAENERKDFYLYVDEFQNFATDSFADILSEARKYRLNLIMAHQYIEQLSDRVKAAVFGNVGTLIVCRIGATDAEELVKEFTPIFTEEDLVNIPKFEMCLKLMIDGIASDPFSAIGLPPYTESQETGTEEKVIKVSRERYAKPKEEVEEKINRWHEDMAASTANKSNSNGNGNNNSNSKPANQNKTIINTGTTQKEAACPPALNNPAPAKKSVELYDAICYRCGKKIQVKFKPDGVRPVFCQDCLILRKQEKEANTVVRTYEEEKNINNKNNNTPEISLQDLSLSKPVSFKGKASKQINNNLNNNKTTTVTTTVTTTNTDTPPQRQVDIENNSEELKEGEDLFF